MLAYRRHQELVAASPSLVEFIAAARTALEQAGALRLPDSTIKGLQLMLAAADLKRHLDGVGLEAAGLPEVRYRRSGALEVIWRCTDPRRAARVLLSVELHEDNTWEWFLQDADGRAHASKAPLRGAEPPKPFLVKLMGVFSWGASSAA